MSCMQHSSQPPLVSVIIPHFNDLSNLRVCYSRIMEQNWPADRLELIVADNNSSYGLDAVREVAPRAVVVPAPVQGAGPARNVGIAASHGDVVALIDSDCVADPEWVAEGVKALKEFDFVGGRVLTTALSPDQPNAIEAYEKVFNFNFRRYIEKVGFTGTGNMFVRRDVFNRVGEFRVVVSEDMEWSFRARSMGYRLGYARSAIVSHPARRSWQELRRRWIRILDEHYAFAKERAHGRVLFAVKALLMPASVVPHAIKVLLSPQLPSFLTRLGAIAVLTRLRLWRSYRMLCLLAADAF
jgi:glycosyltransferase involved in cell wall biosynthesis